MFTGIVEEVGTIREIRVEADQACLSVDARRVLDDLSIGDSISVDGACLTIVGRDDASFTVGLSPETLRRTALGQLTVGSLVNLERAARIGDRLGGHYVQGHVDAVARITERQRDGDSLILSFEPPAGLMRYIVEKGFVALDGISLTVAGRTESRFSVVLVAYTQEQVGLSRKDPGAAVNLEVDVMAKYAETLLDARPGVQRLSK